jgi:glycosyltransferase involved in cell wall biosynthesis
MRVLFFGRYDPNYSRNVVLMKGLRLNGVEVVECRVSPSARFWPVRLIWQYVRQWPQFDVMLVAFPGQEVMLLARWLTRKHVIFDAFTSHYGGYVLDRERVERSSVRARWYRFLDRWSCRLASRVLLDTQAHVEFFISQYGLDRGPFRRIFVGTDTDAFQVVDEPGDESFRVHFHGHYIPHHGAEVIVRAAVLVRDEGIRFRLIGSGQLRSKCESLAKHLNADNIEFIDNVPYRDLAGYMSSSHVCLGVFGTNPKTFLTITNKIFEASACGRVTVTADTSALRELFTPGYDIVAVQPGSPERLADALRMLRSDVSMRKRIAAHARKLIDDRCSPRHIGNEVKEILKELIYR